jgi:hypothetical protein
LILFFGVSLLNIFQKNRKTISELENRTLSTFPEFSINSLKDGTFFKGIDSFISDTFIYRDELLSISQKINSYKSLDAFIKDDENSFVFIPSKAGEMDSIKENLKDLETEPLDEKTIDIMEETLFDEIDNLTKETTIETIEETFEYKEDDATGENISGYILYKGIPYHVGWVDMKGTDRYVKTLDLYSKTFPSARVTSIIAPMSSLILENKRIQESMLNQNDAIDKINAKLPAGVNALNICPVLYAHKDEDIYFKYDHHWTHRGSYYAYEEFCKSIGDEPTPLNNMEEVVLNKGWQGTTYATTGDERLKSGREALVVYFPTKQNMMVLVDKKSGEIRTYDSCIHRDWVSYTALIGGDNPYTVISIPENPQDKNVLVIKDSYGNGFSTYLCENFGNIIILDPRHINYNILPIIKDFNITDVVFMLALYDTCNKVYLDKADGILTMPIQ